jgi:hypothetical protein
MTSFRLLVLSSLGAAVLVACSASSGSHSATAGTGGSGTRAHATGTSSTGTHAAGTGGKVTSSGTGAQGGSSTGGSGGSPVFDLDSGSGDGSSACQHLNIGILGNPGADPSANFQQWLVMAGTSVQRIQTMTGVPLTQADIQQFDVVILDWLTRDYTTSEAAEVAAFVSGGGGLVSMSGYDNNTTDDWHANSLLAPLEVAYTGPLLSGPVTMFATHPITLGLTSVTFNGGYAIADLGGTASTRTPIAFLPSPSGSGTVTVGYAIQMGKGHAFVWGDEWIEFDSEWSTLPQIKQLWVQIFEWISPMNKCALMPPA